MMWMYSAALFLLLAVSSPWWLLQVLTTDRYREGLGERIGRVPNRLRQAVTPFAEDRQVVWVHAVSVGEVLAATRLVPQLEKALNGKTTTWRVVVSTTTRTGQAIARERFGAERVFYFPLDFAFAVRAYLRVLRPAALVLMESELWPRVLHECEQEQVPVLVVNARVSDRSFERAVMARKVWRSVLQKVSLWMAQTEEDARRLLVMGVEVSSVRATGNLKYDVRAPKESRAAALIKEAAGSRPIIVAGSTTDGDSGDRNSWEEVAVIQAWWPLTQARENPLLVLAPRHPERFAAVESAVLEFRYALMSRWLARLDVGEPLLGKSDKPREIIVLDTIGDLAAVYGVADLAFVGGTLVKRGGHNPLEPAQFGVPVVIGPSYENFRDIVGSMEKANAIRIVPTKQDLRTAFSDLMTNRKAATGMGQRGRKVFEDQQGATARAVQLITATIRGESTS